MLSLFSLLFLSLSLGCSSPIPLGESSEASEAPAPEPLPLPVLSSEEIGKKYMRKEVNLAVDEFNWKYFHVVNKKENILYSPFGISSALFLLSNGAQEGTAVQNEILKLYQNPDVDRFNKFSSNYIKYLQNTYQPENSENKLVLATRLAVNGNKDVMEKIINDDFRVIAIADYDSEVVAADFKNNLSEEKERIREWVDEKSEHFMPNYDSLATNMTVFDLLNIVYFNGRWEVPFQASSTSKEIFANSDVTSSTVSMMNHSFKEKESVQYYEDKKYRGIVLPYKKDNQGNVTLAMYLILPLDKSLQIATSWDKEDDDYKKDFIERLKDADPFSGVVNVKLPKFTMEKENSLAKDLEAMGLDSLFSDKEGFNLIFHDQHLLLDNAKQQAKIRVDEEGTEAVAVTEFALKNSMASPNQKMDVKNFFCDIPFLFEIRDISYDLPLFTGVVNNLPSEN